MADLPVLEARGVAKTYRQGEVETTVLHGVDFEVRAGEFVAIVGPSGSGKSTLLHILGLMDMPTAGEMRVRGEAVRPDAEERNSALRNGSLGFVFQFDSLLHEFTVLENVLMPARIAYRRDGGDWAALEARAREQLAAVGLAALADRFPPQLSGGERQRVAIARALMNRPAVLLADEPTGNLDRNNGETVFAILKRQTETAGVAVVLVTHDEKAAAFASRTVHLLDGKIQGAERNT